MYTTRFHERIEQIDAGQWNRLAGEHGPFLRHEFLHALERSASVGPGTGWEPRHLSLHDGDRLIAACPLYLKHHSWGEYVFDWAWADAYRTHGLQYYPKLLTAIPFTPSTSRRLLLEPGFGVAEVAPTMTEAIQREAGQHGASSWHVLFPVSEESDSLAEQGLIQRVQPQFHWLNHGYEDFRDFLAGFSSRKRKNVRRERESVASQRVRFHRFSGDTIRQAPWETFYGFYQSTYMMRGMQGYLSPEFFQLISETMPENLLLVMVTDEGRYIAGALYLMDGHTLYGRYWGSLEHYDFLHFETCYYQGIDYCIEQGLERFDAGAQGEHKLKRGFEPVRTWSSHWIRDPRFADAIRNFCREESVWVDDYLAAARDALPFRKI